MFPFNLFPYTNFHELNLDWILSKLKTAVYTVNRTYPDENGNVNLPTVAGVSSVNGVGADGNGNVQIGPTNIGAVATINNFGPDSNGNVYLDAVKVNAVAKVANISPDSNGNVPLTAPEIGGISTINNLAPDSSGNFDFNYLHPHLLTLTGGLTGPDYPQYVWKINNLRIATVNLRAINNTGITLPSEFVVASGAPQSITDATWLAMNAGNRAEMAYIDQFGNIITLGPVQNGEFISIYGMYITEI